MKILYHSLCSGVTWSFKKEVFVRISCIGSKVKPIFLCNHELRIMNLEIIDQYFGDSLWATKTFYRQQTE